MHQASTFFFSNIASHGGYVYYYSVDLKHRWGEGIATRDQIWVQPLGTPTVGMACFKAYEATGNRFYLDAATKAAEALVYGQLQSGGWTNCVDFDPRGGRVAQYRNGRGGGNPVRRPLRENNSSLDDGQTQSAIQLLVRVDKALGFQRKDVHESVRVALDALLAAQFPNGGFPQVWTGPVTKQPVIETLMEIYRVTSDRKYLEPIPRALVYLKRSILPDGKLARYYELKTNNPH